MDINVNALVGVAHLVPIALTLRKVYAPSFDLPEAFVATLARIEAPQAPARRARHHARFDLAC